MYDYLFLLSSMLLEVIDPNIDPDLELNLIYLDLDLNLILFIKEIVYDDKQFTINLCLKKPTGYNKKIHG